MWGSLQTCDLKIDGCEYMPVAVVKYIDEVYIFFSAKVSCSIQSGLTSSNYNSKFTVKRILQ